MIMKQVFDETKMEKLYFSPRLTRRWSQLRVCSYCHFDLFCILDFDVNHRLDTGQLSHVTMSQIKTQACTPNLSNIPSPPPEEDDNVLPATYPDLAHFTFLPDLYLLISRLVELQNRPTNGNADLVDGTGNGLEQTVSRESHNSLRPVSSSGQQPFETRELPAHVYHLKKKIEEAKAVVKGLPDIDQSLEQQEKEIAKLKKIISGIQGRLKSLGQIAAQGNGSKDTVMKGIENGIH